MKKHLIAAAVAGAFAVPAMAQVTVSGTLDVTAYSSQKLSANASAVGVGAAQVGVKRYGTGILQGHGGPSATGEATGSFATNTLNFTATEDLGGGLKVTAYLNQGITQTDGALATRDRWISMAGGFGSFQVGRFASHINNVVAAWTAGTTNTQGSLGGFITGTLPGTSIAIGGGSFSRETNKPMIRYSTPNVNGFVASADVAQGVTSDVSTLVGKAEISQQTINLSYAAGPISAVVALGKRDGEAEGTASVTGARTKADAKVFGASYDLGMARVSYARMEREDKTAAAGVAAFTTVFDGGTNTIRVIIPAGALTLDASLYDGKDKSAAAGTKIDLDGYQLSARYALSKRTYGYFVTGQNKAKATTTGVSASIKSSGSAVGIVHSF